MYNLQQLFENELMREKATEIADDALNAACLSIQTQLGVTDGGLAGVMFSGDDEREAFSASMLEYIKFELYGLYSTFVESSTYHPDLNRVLGDQWDDVQPGLVYAGSFYIEIQNHEMGKYQLILGNWFDGITDDLEALEVPLFLWALGEGYKGLPSHREIFPNPMQLSREHRAELIAYIEASPKPHSTSPWWEQPIRTQDGTAYAIERVTDAISGKYSWYAYFVGDYDIHNCNLIKEEL